MINFSSYIKSLNKELTKDQETNIVESEKYVEKHKLDQLFNVLSNFCFRVNIHRNYWPKSYGNNLKISKKP